MKTKGLILSIFFTLVAQSIFAQNSEWAFFRADTLKSKILWKCDKHNGKIKLNSGGFVVKNKQIVGGLFYIDMRTIKDLDMDAKTYGTAILILQNTLKNEFFEVEKYPFAAFNITRVANKHDDLYTVTGDFTMHGITVCISFDATIIIEDEQIKMTSKTIKLDRTDWGVYRMSPKRPYSDEENGWTVPDELEIQIEIITKKEKIDE